jgi:CRISPR/Cas system-associated protein Cas5 (RAMP superfamily)
MSNNQSYPERKESQGLTRIDVMVSEARQDLRLHRLSNIAAQLSKDDLFTKEWQTYFAGIAKTTRDMIGGGN